VNITINGEEYYDLPVEMTVADLLNTAGCFTGEDAVRTLRLAREAGGWDLVKLEVLSDPKHLYPDMEETVRAAKMLISEGFEVMVYCSDDPVFARKLEDIGCCAIMPLGAPIGSGLGIQNPVNIRLIVEQTQVPVIVDAGVGTASDATLSPDMFYLAATLLAVGALAGFSAGLFGIGGGAVIVPALFFTFSSLGYSQDVVMHSAVATSSAIIVINAVKSVRSHNAHGAVDWDLLWPHNFLQSYALWIGLGSFCAAIWVAPTSGFGFAIAFPAAIGFMISGWNVDGRPYFSIGYVNVLGFIAVAVIAYFTIPIGAKLAHTMSQKRLKGVFGICLFFVALNMARKVLMG